MKVNLEIDMTPEEARRMMGLPDVSAMQEKIVAEMEKRILAAMDTSDPEAMWRAWGAPAGFEQFQKFLWDSAGRMAAGKKEPSK